MSKIIVVINQSNKTSYSTSGACLDTNDTYVMSYKILVFLVYNDMTWVFIA